MHAKDLPNETEQELLSLMQLDDYGLSDSVHAPMRRARFAALINGTPAESMARVLYFWASARIETCLARDLAIREELRQWHIRNPEPVKTKSRKAA